MRNIAWAGLLAVLSILMAAAVPGRALAEDGYDLWLRYPPVEAPVAGDYRAVARWLVPGGNSPTIAAVTAELTRGLNGLLGVAPAVSDGVGEGAVVYGTPTDSRLIAELGLDLADLGREGYLIRSQRIEGRPVTVIAANSDVGVLYGAFAFLRLMQTHQSVEALDIRSAPKVALRVLNHWDNLDRHVERGYAGQSIWDWHRLPDYTPELYTD